MERRKEPRLRVDAAVTVTVLGRSRQAVMMGRVVDMSGSGLRLTLPAPVPCGSAVKVEGDNMMVLGEVCRSAPEPGGYEVALTVAHALGSLAELERLNRALLGERTPETVRV